MIDLERDQYSFEKKLKDQNKSLLQIQLELEALSVEGVNYSLEDQLRKAQLEEQLAEQQDERTEFLYDHEVDVRKDALDKEEEAFEEKINLQIKVLENYLDREGVIRQDAVNLINGQTQEFYDDLLDYTMNYTSTSRAEFQNLWDTAYEALRKYGNGVIDVDATLAFLMGSIKQIEANVDALETAINNAKSAATQFTNTFEEGLVGVEKQLADVIEAAQTLGTVQAPTMVSSSSKGVLTNDARQIYKNILNGKTGADIFRKSTYHDGGVVQHQGIKKNSEVFAKLLAGEIVVTQDQASNFFNNTLPKLTASNVTNNNSSPVINMGDINIAGNADSSTVAQLREVKQEIVNDVFKAVNNYNSTYNGRRTR